MMKHDTMHQWDSVGRYGDNQYCQSAQGTEINSDQYDSLRYD